MKKIISTAFASAVMMTLSVAVSSCSSSDNDLPEVFTELTLEASKGEYTAPVETRTITEANSTVVSTWKTSDKVAVYKKGWGAKIGDLAPKADSDNARTKLDGSVNSAGMNVGDKMDLITPRTDWSYAEQDGTLEKISSTYDYAVAEAQVIYIDKDNNDKLYGSNAIFAPQQTILKFTLKNDDGSQDLVAPSLTIVSNSGKIVLSRNLDGSTVNYGGLTVTPSAATKTFFVALRNDHDGADTYTFTTRANNTVYCYTKENVTFKPGEFWDIVIWMKDMNNTYSERTGYTDKGDTVWQ